MENEMDVVVRPRQGGKTYELVQWVLEGQRTNAYPGWSRVLLLPDRQRFDAVRRSYWGEVEDFDHRVYEFSDWQRAHMYQRDLEVAIDDVENLIPRFAGRLVRVSINGEAL